MSVLYYLLLVLRIIPIILHIILNVIVIVVSYVGGYLISLDYYVCDKVNIRFDKNLKPMDSNQGFEEQNNEDDIKVFMN